MRSFQLDRHDAAADDAGFVRGDIASAEVRPRDARGGAPRPTGAGRASAGDGAVRGVRGPASGSRLLLVGLVLVLATSAASAQRTGEMDRLAGLLRIAPGMSVAEIGAGRGRETIDMAGRIGPTGRMFSTEIDPARLEDIRRAVREAGLDNVTVVQGEATATGLPEACCDAIYMRTVYHHFTHPTAMLDGLRAALRPGGLLAVIDFAPRSASARPSGTPGRRGGHGISSAQLAGELRQAGFDVLEEVESWSGRNFLVLARRR